MKTIISGLITALLVTAAKADTQTYDFNDPKDINHVVFMLDAPLEFISGTGRGITGMVDFDFDNPEALSGSIELTAESLSVPNQSMEEHMHGDDWLDIETNPTIVFTVTSLDVASKEDNTINGNINGTLNFMGTKKSLVVPVKLTYIEGGAKDRNRTEGDLLIVRSDFSIKLDEYGINISPPARLKVSNQADIKVVIAGRTL